MYNQNLCDQNSLFSGCNCFGCDPEELILSDSWVKARKQRIGGRCGGWGYVVNTLEVRSTTCALPIDIIQTQKAASCAEVLFILG